MKMIVKFGMNYITIFFASMKLYIVIIILLLDNLDLLKSKLLSVINKKSKKIFWFVFLFLNNRIFFDNKP